MTDEIRIRPACAEDLAALQAFILPFVDDGRLLPRTTEELHDLINNGFIALMEDRVVGCAALEIYSSKLAEIRSLAVSTGFRGRGIGRQLVDACVERARQRRILEVMAITSSESFFMECGFDFTLPGEKKALFLNTRNDDQ